MPADLEKDADAELSADVRVARAERVANAAAPAVVISVGDVSVHIVANGRRLLPDLWNNLLLQQAVCNTTEEICLELDLLCWHCDVAAGWCWRQFDHREPKPRP